MGFKIVVLVTPKDCQTCHPQQAAEFLASRHADAASFIGSLDNVLGEIIGGKFRLQAMSRLDRRGVQSKRSGQMMI